ncbi:protein S100-A11-like [Hypanus sabinus]|uniref:protein S100-A11-like n=1 Tax=Hypanus sabinus TaxID=79690 RepID=UPI0028C3E892|nr:protein S100-A11-like [Hypanus sabinus]
MTELENCISTLISVFQNYAKKGGDPYTLSREEARELVKSQLPSLVKNPHDKAGLDKLMVDLDSDGQVDFQEFAIMVISISACCHDLLKGASKKK